MKHDKMAIVFYVLGSEAIALMMKVTSNSEMSVDVYRNRFCNDPEENLNSFNVVLLYIRIAFKPTSFISVVFFL